MCRLPNRPKMVKRAGTTSSDCISTTSSLSSLTQKPQSPDVKQAFAGMAQSSLSETRSTCEPGSFQFTIVNDKGLLLCESSSGHTLTSLSRPDKAVGVSERLAKELSRAGLLSVSMGFRPALPYSLTVVIIFSCINSVLTEKIDESPPSF